MRKKRKKRKKKSKKKRKKTAFRREDGRLEDIVKTDLRK